MCGSVILFNSAVPDDEPVFPCPADEVRQAFFKLLRAFPGSIYIGDADPLIRLCEGNEMLPCGRILSDRVKNILRENIFGIAIGGGIRIAISAISEKACRIVPAKIAAAIKRVNGQ